MNGYLLVVRCWQDDIPCGLFETLDDLKIAANGMTKKMLAENATAAGFPNDAVPVDDSPVQAIRFIDGKPVDGIQVGMVAADPVDTDVALLRPAVDRFLADIRSNAPVETLLLVLADAVHDFSANVGEDASDTAADIRSLVYRWRARSSVC